MSRKRTGGRMSTKPPGGTDIACGTWDFPRGFGQAHVQVVATVLMGKLVIWEILSGKTVMVLDLVRDAEVSHD